MTDREFTRRNIKEKCERCQGTKALTVHHVIGRRTKAVRHYAPNAATLCYKCHTVKPYSAHQDPRGFLDWIIEWRGDEWWEDLNKKANTKI